MFPWLKPWVKNLKQMLKNSEVHVKEMKRIINGLQETLNPQELRGFVDSFLVRKQSAEVSHPPGQHIQRHHLAKPAADSDLGKPSEQR